MKILYDISMTIHPGMMVWKNYEKKKVHFSVDSDFATGTVHETRISINAHTGTHIDAPLHVYENGATLDAIPAERLIGPARVVDFTNVSPSIGREHLEPLGLQPGEWLLIKTTDSFNETDTFNREFVFLNAEGAAYLAGTGISGVAIDALGIERDQPGYPTHKALFDAGILIVEGVRLKDVPEGRYTFLVAPLKLKGTDGAPARAFLLGD
jgi:arylformamidase